MPVVLRLVGRGDEKFINSGQSSEPGHQLAVSHLLTLKAPLTRTMGPGRTLDGLNLCRVLTIMTSISILNTIFG